MHKLLPLTALILLAACAPQPPKEAKCKCFSADGSSTGACDFARLPPEPVTYSFAGGYVNGTAAKEDLVLCGIANQ